MVILLVSLNFSMLKLESHHSEIGVSHIDTREPLGTGYLFARQIYKKKW